MSDIDDPGLRDFLTGSFLLTEESRKILESFFGSLNRNEGRGFFLEGNYGSGKSHLLTIISLLLTYPQSWSPLLEQTGKNASFQGYKEMALNGNYLVVNISLVEHSNRQHLEDIINEAIVNSLKEEAAVELESALTEDGHYRRQEFYRLLQGM